MPYRPILVVFFVLAAAPSAAVPAGEPAADGLSIDGLVRRLGSDAWEEREAATRVLARVGAPALAALRKAATGQDAEVRRRAADLIERIENGFDQLLADYRAYGLPLPPDAAPLVRYVDQPGGVNWIIDHDGPAKKETTEPRYALAFLVAPAAGERLAELLHATDVQSRKAKWVGDALDPRRLTAQSMRDVPLDPRGSLVLALQMHARGWGAARVVFEEGFRVRSSRPPRTELRLLAWDYWDKRLSDPEDDCLPAAARQMKALLADEPELDTPDDRALLRSLEAALAPSRAKPGSVETMVDDLVHAGGAELDASVFTGRPVDERFVRLFNLGFDAVPTLLDHLGDDRLTRHLETPGFWFGPIGAMPPPRHYRVGDMAASLLRLIAGQDARRRWPDGPKDLPGLRRIAREWWDEARKQGEEKYLVAHALPPTDEGEGPRDEVWPDSAQIRLLGKRHPQRLAALYREVLDKRVRVVTGWMAEAVADGPLPREEKIGLLAYAAGNRKLENRSAALWRLKELDRDRFVSLLVAALDGLPPTPTASYSDCPEATLASLAFVADDPRAWRALGRAARRADVGLRMEFLKNVRWTPPTASGRRDCLTFLAGFLDDDALRDVTPDPKKYAGIYAGAWFKRLKVQDFAAWMIARLLELGDDPTPEWDAGDWTRLRDRARAALRRERVEAAAD